MGAFYAGGLVVIQGPFFLYWLLKVNKIDVKLNPTSIKEPFISKVAA